MTAHHYVAHRLGFPAVREFAKRVKLVGAMVTHQVSGEYLQAQMPEPQEEEENFYSPNYYF